MVEINGNREDGFEIERKISVEEAIDYLADYAEKIFRTTPNWKNDYSTVLALSNTLGALDIIKTIPPLEKKLKKARKEKKRWKKKYLELRKFIRENGCVDIDECWPD